MIDYISVFGDYLGVWMTVGIAKGRVQKLNCLKRMLCKRWSTETEQQKVAEKMRVRGEQVVR